LYRTIYIIIEGQTEERFVKDILAEFFLEFRIFFKPILIETSRSPHRKYKGGLVNYNHIRKDINRVLQNGDCHKVTTMIDYYRLPDNFPGKNTLPSGSIYDKVKYLEDCWFSDIGSQKFIPYIQIHEFEALLFSDIKGFEEVFPGRKVNFMNIINRFSNPELINDDPKTAPSKRIENIVASYSKTLHGIDIAEIVGIEKMIEKCPHFKEWIEKLRGS
jgi:hypothetical protein